MCKTTATWEKKNKIQKHNDLTGNMENHSDVES